MSRRCWRASRQKIKKINILYRENVGNLIVNPKEENDRRCI